MVVSVSDGYFFLADSLFLPHTLTSLLSSSSAEPSDAPSAPAPAPTPAGPVAGAPMSYASVVAGGDAPAPAPAPPPAPAPAPAPAAGASGDAEAEEKADESSFEPVFFNEGLDTESLGKVLAFFRSAEKTMEVCVFNLTLNAIADEIYAAHNRGVAVRLIGDDDCATSPGSDIFSLKEKGVNVVTDNSSSLVHKIPR